MRSPTPPATSAGWARSRWPWASAPGWRRQRQQRVPTPAPRIRRVRHPLVRLKNPAHRTCATRPRSGPHPHRFFPFVAHQKHCQVRGDRERGGRHPANRVRPRSRRGPDSVFACWWSGPASRTLGVSLATVYRMPKPATLQARRSKAN